MTRESLSTNKQPDSNAIPSTGETEATVGRYSRVLNTFATAPHALIDLLKGVSSSVIDQNAVSLYIRDYFTRERIANLIERNSKLQLSMPKSEYASSKYLAARARDIRLYFIILEVEHNFKHCRRISSREASATLSQQLKEINSKLDKIENELDQ